MYILPDSAHVHSETGIIRRQALNNSTGLGSQPGDQSQSQSQSQNQTQTWTYVVAAIIAAILVGTLFLLLYTYARRLKIAGRSPKYVPTKFLKQKWEAWKPQGKYANIRRNSAEQDTGEGAGSVAMTEPTTDSAGVNRNTSVRSVMTLPPYSQKPKETEEVIGREGERGGIDTVVELPETVDEEEERREAEMESLYQIRQARRQEIAERDERRRERREARDRGDWARLEELRRDARVRRDQNNLTGITTNSASASNVNLTAEMLIAEHNTRGRDRRVSSVSYAQLGQVRHDGTRIRSNSGGSERSGLLNSAAPMGSHSRNASEATLLSLGGLPQPRYRDRSNSGATSISASSFENVTPPSEYERPGTSRAAASSHHTAGSISDVSADGLDTVSEGIVVSAPDSDDIAHPPAYDGHDWGDAPEYTEAERVARANSNATMRTAQEQLNRAPSTVSRTDTLSITTPSIRIETPTAPNTPVVPRRLSDELTTPTASSTETRSA